MSTTIHQTWRNILTKKYIILMENHEILRKKVYKISVCFWLRFWLYSGRLFRNACRTLSGFIKIYITEIYGHLARIPLGAV